jgi:hypothetical protein
MQQEEENITQKDIETQDMEFAPWELRKLSDNPEYLEYVFDTPIALDVTKVYLYKPRLKDKKEYHSVLYSKCKTPNGTFDASYINNSIYVFGDDEWFFKKFIANLSSSINPTDANARVYKNLDELDQEINTQTIELLLQQYKSFFFNLFSPTALIQQIDAMKTADITNILVKKN